MEFLASVERDRLRKQKRALGEKGLEKKEQELSEAQAHNEVGTPLRSSVQLPSRMFVVVFRCQRQPPPEVLRTVAVPSVKSIRFLEISSSSNHPNDNQPPHPAFPLHEIPVPFQLDDIETKFVHVRLTKTLR